MSGSNELVQVLFDCAAVHAVDRKASFEWLREKSKEFAAGFDKAVDDGDIDAGAAAVVLYCQEFARVFGPGMSTTPGQIISVISKRLDYAASERKKLADVVVSPVAEDAGDAKPGASSSVIEGAVQDRKARETDEAAEKSAQDARDSALLNPVRPEDLPISHLDASARAKGALRGLGLETFGDVKRYSEAKKLEDVNGISDEAAESILKQIEDAIENAGAK